MINSKNNESVALNIKSITPWGMVGEPEINGNVAEQGARFVVTFNFNGKEIEEWWYVILKGLCDKDEKITWITASYPEFDEYCIGGDEEFYNYSVDHYEEITKMIADYLDNL